MAGKGILKLYCTTERLFLYLGDKRLEYHYKEETIPSLAECLNEVLESIPKEYFAVDIILSAGLVNLNQLTLPQMKRQELIKVLERKVSLMKVFEDEGRNWGFQQLSTTGSSNNILLYVASHFLIKTLIDTCEKRDLVVNTILPLHVLPLPAEKKLDKDGDVLLVILKNSVLVRVHRGHDVLFTREFSCSLFSGNQEEKERLKREVERTLLYAKQQFQIFTPHVGFITNRAMSLERIVEDVHFICTIPDWVGMQKHAQDSKVTENANVIPASYILERKKIRGFYLTLILFFLFFIYSIFNYFTMYNTLKESQQRLINERTEFRTDSLQKDLNTLEGYKSRIEKSSSVVQYIESSKHSALGGWLMAHISKVIPNELLLSQLNFVYNSSEQSWYCEISGFSPRSATESAQLLSSFQKALEAHPVNMQIKQAWIEQWVSNLHVGDTKEKDIISKRFYIEGRLF